MKAKILKVSPAGEDHQVVTVKGGANGYRREPCPPCPWKVKNDGTFPAEPFRISANTAYDMSQKKFGCHASGVTAGHTCAGFLLKGADNNLAVRLGRFNGHIGDEVSTGGEELHPSYRSMAIANGVDPLDPVLKRCRP